jgi:hypothetical protein
VPQKVFDLAARDVVAFDIGEAQHDVAVQCELLGESCDLVVSGAPATSPLRSSRSIASQTIAFRKARPGRVNSRASQCSLGVWEPQLAACCAGAVSGSSLRPLCCSFGCGPLVAPGVDASDWSCSDCLALIGTTEAACCPCETCDFVLCASCANRLRSQCFVIAPDVGDSDGEVGG